MQKFRSKCYFNFQVKYTYKVNKNDTEVSTHYAMYEFYDLSAWPSNVN